jgi:hypothetical protein
VAPIFFTRHFLLIEVVSFVMTTGVNGLIDYFMEHHKGGPWYLISSNMVLTVLIFALIMSLLIFAGGGDIHKRIKKGLNEPVRRDALQDSVLKRFLFFPIGEPSWKKRLPLFMWWAVMVPGLITVVALYFFCWTAKGFGKLQNKDCECTLGEYVVWTEMWKGSIAVFMTAVNYAASSNDEQSELQAGLLGEDDESAAAGPDSLASMSPHGDPDAVGAANLYSESEEPSTKRV